MRPYIYLLIIPILLFSNCSDDKDNDPIDPTYNTVNEKLNNWTYKQMDEYYYWYKNLPRKSSLSYNAAPEDFYKSLLYSADRFSYSDYESLPTRSNSITTYDIGFHYLFFYWGDTNSNPQQLFLLLMLNLEQWLVLRSKGVI